MVDIEKFNPCLQYKDCGIKDGNSINLFINFVIIKTTQHYERKRNQQPDNGGESYAY